MPGCPIALVTLMWVQDWGGSVVVDVPCATAGPVAVVCGLLDLPPDPKAAWRPVRLTGPGGLVGSGVLVDRQGSAVLHAVVPRLAAGTTELRLGRGPPLPPAAPVPDVADGFVWEGGGLRVAFEADGLIDFGWGACRLDPLASRGGSWRRRSSDPVRTVLVWEDRGPAGSSPSDLRLYAVLQAGVPSVELTLVVRGRAGGLPAARGLVIGPADALEEPEWPPDPAESRPLDAEGESVPEEPPFELVMESLHSGLWEEVAPASGSSCAAVRRFGPTAPARIERAGSACRLLAVEPSEGIAPGEERVMRVRLGNGAAGADVLVRPERPPSAPLLGRFRPASRCRDLARLARVLDAALGVFRADPRHGLLHRRGDLGDWKMDSWRVGNLEWDTSLGFLLRHFELGRRIDATQAIAGVEHLLLRDRDPASGLFFQHGREHRSGVIEPGHHWVEGVAAVAGWLADPWLEDEARALAGDQLSAFERLDLAAALPRSLAWALTAACALHDLAPDRARSLRLIRKIERFVLSRQTTAGHFTLEASTAQEGNFRVSPFVDGGILLPALERAARITRTRGAAAAIGRARQALLRDGIVREPDGPVLVSSILIEPKNGRVVSSGGRAEGEEVVLFLAGVATAGAEEDVAGLLRRAQSSLTLDSRTYLGKGISMLMRALPAYAARKGCR